MFFGGKKVVAAPKKSSLNVVAANKRAREERERERVRETRLLLLQASIRQHHVLRRLASDVRAHWIVENPHFTITDAVSREEWLLRAFREFLFSMAHLQFFDPSMVPSILPFLSHEYFALAANPNYRYQWLNQAVDLVKLSIRHYKLAPSSFSTILASITHRSKFFSLVGTKSSEIAKAEILSFLHTKLWSFMATELETRSSAAMLPSLEIPVLQSILDVLESRPITQSVAFTIIRLASSQLKSEIFSESTMCAQLLSLVVDSLKLLEASKANPMMPITSQNYEQVAQFIRNKMQLYSALATTSAGSVEVFAAEIALQLEQINNFEKEYRRELEEEEDFLDATDVPDIEARQRAVRASKTSLEDTLTELSAVATTVFSEDRLNSLISKLSEMKDEKSALLASFDSIAVLIFRLKNTIGISTSAFLALASPLIPLWSTLYERYKTGLTVPQIDSSAALLSLYCQSYAFYLATKITDSDFHSKQTYLKLAENRQMVDFFKSIIKYRCEHRFSVPIPDSFIGLMKSFNLLLLQFQKRNYMRTWAKTDELVISELRYTQLASSSHVSHLIAIHCPMLIPMLEKVKLFTHWIQADREEHQGDPLDWGSPQVTVSIRRGPTLLADAFSKLIPLHGRLKEKLKVQFLSEDGTPEPGIDGGGLFRELFTEVIKLAFSPDFGLFSATEEHSLYPNPHSHLLVDESLRKFQFLGQLLGKCIYESLLVDLPLAQFFLNVLQGHENSVRDLESYDPMIFQSMQQVLDMDEEKLKELSLTFEFGTKNLDGSLAMVELVPGGKNIPITSKNVVAYVQHVADLRLNKSILPQSQAFLRGLSDVIQLKWLSLFTAPELSLAICGGGRLDIEDLRQNVEFAGGFHDEHPTVLLLWQVLEELDSEEQQAFLKFVTSVSRPPLLGFAALKPRLCLRLNKTDTSYLPSANTCLNLFKMPAYPNKQLLKEKLLYAIKSGARFELS